MDTLSAFKALGHPFRYRVVQALLKGKIHSCCGEIRSYEQGCCVTDLTSKFDMSQSTISHHLSILVESGIVTMEKRGLWSVYLVSPMALSELHNVIGSWLELTNNDGEFHQTKSTREDV